jgi:hypothetical protein
MYTRNDEPSVEELLTDEAARLLMARDGLSDAIVRALVRDVQRRLGERQRLPGRRLVEHAA